MPPTTEAPTEAPTTEAPATMAPTTEAPTEAPTTEAPATMAPTTEAPTEAPTTEAPTTEAPAAGYMIAPQDTSCTAACDQLGRVCDVEYIQYAAQSLQRCLNIILDLGKKTPHSGQYE